MLTYGITPPKAKYTEEKILEIAERQTMLIRKMDIDALILYDIQDESDRTPDNRPYPFLPTLDPVVYSKIYLKNIHIPKIHFRCVGNYLPEQLEKELIEEEKDHYVFVGASSRTQKVKMRLEEAYAIARNTNITMGGIMIPERHQKKNDEHLRIKNKIDRGCNFFISQVVYHSEASKNFLSDYFYFCENNGMTMKPIIFTLSLCGSPKTLDFLKWLGVSIPKWVENDLINSPDILQKSFDISHNIFHELNGFAQEKNIPIGFNIESVAIKKDEIEASTELLRKISNEYRLKDLKQQNSV